MSFESGLANAAKAGMCGWLANGGNQAITQVLIGGVMTGAAAVPSFAAGAGLLALNASCAYDPSAGPVSTGSHCTGAAEATGQFIKAPGQAETEALTLYGVTIATERRVVAEGRHYFRFNGSMGPNGQNPVTSGETWYSTSQTEYVRYGPSKLKVTACTLPPSVPQPNAPVTYTDPGTTCTYRIEHLAWQMDSAGRVGAIQKISSVQSRASGGIISGCNFNPVLYVTPPGGGGGGGGVTLPWFDLPDGPNGPWWKEIVEEIGAEFVGNLVKGLVGELLEVRTQPVVYRLNTVCEVDADGEPINSATEISIPSTNQISSLVNRVDALSVLLQAHKNYRQPVCPTPKTPEVLAGKGVSVQFLSETKSPEGNRELRKVFRYRDQTAKDLALHRDHWKDFTWTSGPWQVISKGLPWGRPQVWASTPEEGKRVLSHAAAIAGVNLNAPAHRWQTREVLNDRYGPELKMRVRLDARGKAWVTQREGPNGLPFVAG